MTPWECNAASWMKKSIFRPQTAFSAQTITLLLPANNFTRDLMTRDLSFMTNLLHSIVKKVSTGVIINQCRKYYSPGSEHPIENQKHFLEKTHSAKNETFNPLPVFTCCKTLQPILLHCGLSVHI